MFGEAPVAGDDDLLTTRELVLATTETLNGILYGSRLSSYRQENLVDLDASNQTVGLSESVTHTSLESIGSSTGQHLIDTEYVVRVDANTQVERVSSSALSQVLVGADTSSFQSLRRDLLLLERDQVDADW